MASNPTRNAVAEECPYGDFATGRAHHFVESTAQEMLFCRQCGERIPLKPEPQAEQPVVLEAEEVRYCPHPECYAAPDHEGKHTTISGAEFTEEERPAVYPF